MDFMVKLAKTSLFILSPLLIFFVIMKFNSKEFEIKPYERYANQIINNFVDKIEKEYNLSCTATGGSMPNDVEALSIYFKSCRKCSIEEARILHVKVTEELIKMVNEHEKIRPYLREYPFNAKGALVSILFIKSDNSSYKDGGLTFIKNWENKVKYYSDDEILKEYVLLQEEPYEEAFKIVQNRKQQ